MLLSAYVLCDCLLSSPCDENELVYSRNFPTVQLNLAYNTAIRYSERHVSLSHIDICSTTYISKAQSCLSRMPAVMTLHRLRRYYCVAVYATRDTPTLMPCTSTEIKMRFVLFIIIISNFIQPMGLMTALVSVKKIRFHQ